MSRVAGGNSVNSAAGLIDQPIMSAHFAPQKTTSVASAIDHGVTLEIIKNCA